LKVGASLARRWAARGALVLVAGVVLVGAVLLLQTPREAPHKENAIVAENQQPGSQGWRIPQPGFLVADDKAGQIKGYASATSANTGGELTLYVSVSPAQSMSIDIYRMGWYGGKGGRFLEHIGPLDASQQPPCPMDQTTGLLACAWAPTVTLQVPRAWTTGVYLAVLTNEQRYQNYVPFVVRDDSHVGGLLYKQPVNTYQAYNNYPDEQTIGKSLYDYNSYGWLTVGGTKGAVKVSFDRPYAHDGSGDFFKWEFNLLRWLERLGYDVSYVTDVDIDAWPQHTLHASGILSAGHDEYWTRRVYLATARARDNGVNLAFFGANAAYWQVRYEPSASNAADRILVCYREGDLDPIANPALKTVLWSEALQQPEQTLLGLSFSALMTTNTDYVVANSSNWVYAGTGFRDGDVVPGIVGYEADSALQYPTPRSRQGTSALLSFSPVQDTSGRQEHASSSIYQAPGGAWVFASGTSSWSWALDADGYYDPRIGQVTANVVDTLLNRPARALGSEPATRQGLYRRAVLLDGPLAYWRPSEAVDWHLPDASGHHFDGLLSGGLTLEGEGGIVSERDGALTSDGTGKVVLRSLPPLVDFTIEAWTNLADDAWNSDVFYDNAVYGAPDHVRLLLRPGGRVTSTFGYFGVWLDGTEYVLQPVALGASNTGQWVHWAMTRQGATLRLYRNGVQVGQRTDLPPASVANLSGTLFSTGDRFLLKGSVDDVAVYGSALTADQLRDHIELARRVPTPPAITPRLSGRQGENGWFISDVALTWTVDTGGFDLESTVGCEPARVIVDTPGQAFTCTAATLGGSASQVATIQRDATPPVVQATRSPPPNTSGWNNGDVTVRFVCQDQTSGVADCPDPIAVSSEGSEQSVSRTARDAAGNDASVSLGGINIDRTPPTLVGSPAVAADWYPGDVVIQWRAEDALSGIAAAPADSVIGGEGTALTTAATVVDRAGNRTTATSAAINIDRSPPSVLFTGNQRTYTVDQTLAIGCAVLDSLSGPATTQCQGASGPAYAFGVGETTIQSTAADRAGNTRGGTTTFTVQVTTDSLCTLSRRFSVTDAVGRSLCSKLADAAAGNDDAVRAYLNQVEDQTGQAVLPENAAILSSLARKLFAQ